MALSPSGDPDSDGMERPGSDPSTPGRPVVPALLRAVLYLLFVIILLAVGMSAALPVVAPDVADRITKDPDFQLGLGQALAVQALLLPLVLLGTAFFVRRIDRRRLPWIGVSLPPGALRAALVAAGLAAVAPFVWLALVSIAANVELAGPVAAEDKMTYGRLMLFLGGFLVAALAEEIMLRGYVYTVLAARYGFVNAAGASAAIFAVLYGGNPDVGPVALINTFLLGLLFGALRHLTGSIAACVAAHAAWNVVVACVISVPLSGIDSPHLLAVEVSGNVYATGGEYGPEASLLLTGILVPLVFVAVLWAGGDHHPELDASEPDTDRPSSSD